MSERWRRYWFDMPAPPARMTLLRVLLFGMLAGDLWLKMLEHAPRYGAGDFNVPQIDALSGVLPVPSPAIVGALWLFGGFLALRVALGIAVRASLIALTVCYFGVYLWSQADSYQHHYLMGLLLFLSCFVPEDVWVPPADRQGPPPTSWALRLIYVQMGLLYFWGTFTKLHAVWLDGSTLKQFLTAPAALDMLFGTMRVFGFREEQGFVFAAWATVLLELAAAIMYVTRRYTILGLLMLPMFHIGIEVFEFDIDWFSYYMIGLNLILLAPDGWMTWLERHLVKLRRRVDGLRGRVPGVPGGGAAMAVAVVAAAACAGLASRIPVEGGTELAVLVFVAVLAAQWPWNAAALAGALRRGAAHLAIAGALLLTLFHSEEPYDYYRLWAGDLKRRGDREGAMRLYEKANALSGEAPARHLALAGLYEEAGRHEDAVAALREDVRRYEKALAADKVRTRAGAAADAWFDLADRHDALVERCERLARLLRRAGGGVDEADRLTRQALTHRQDARAALREGAERDPRSPRGRKGLARVGD